MALIKWLGEDVWEPFHELAELESELPKWFGRRLMPGRWLTLPDGGRWMPEVDVTEEKDRILVRADLPGMKQEEISVEVADGVLTIKGERKRESETKEGKTYRMERSYGSFLRSFTLPAGVDAAKVNATYKNGVLEIALPKLAEAKAKQVKVEVK
ncbi:MAG: Hsp20/alpha crystallin family protein [Candidatus Omnitrophica bacterium]|nr:Hsp20/alpha crystallin family protein [Candidatus Omnitrophota bacterium]